MMPRPTAGLAILALALPVIGDTVGFRTDGTGRYPDATPATTWDTRENVVWKTRLSSWSNATTVLWKDRIYVCSEPDLLVCVSKADGAVIWEKANDYASLADTPAEAETIRAGTKRGQVLQDQLNRANGQLRRVRRQLKKDGDNAELKAKAEKLQADVTAAKAAFAPYQPYCPPRTHKANGYSSATPMTDGKHIYAVFGTGVTACYDMNGQRIWARKIELPPHGWGSCVSPVLSGKVLVVRYNKLWGLDPATGETLWSASSKWGWGTPVPAKLGDEDVLFTCKGDVVRTRDGKILHSKLADLAYNSPLKNGDIVYYIQGDPKAYRIPASAETKPELLWSGKMQGDRYYGTPLLHDGLIYAINQKQHFTVLDAATGEKVYEKRLDFPKRATVYPSITLGGTLLFVSNEAGCTKVIEPGRQYNEVASNQVEAFRSCPVFEGSRMYLRARVYLYCIGK